MANITAKDITTRREMLAEQQKQARVRLKQAQADLGAIDGAIQETTYFEQLIVEREAKRPPRKAPTRRKK